MSHLSADRSVEDGQPTRNYEFTRGLLAWRYSSSQEDQFINTYTFRGGVGISDGGMQFTGDPSADALTITMPVELEIPLMFRVIAPSAPIYVRVWEYHVGQADWVICWVGTISGAKWVSDDRCEIICEYITASLEAPGLRLAWQRPCPHTLYDEFCRVDPDAYEVPALVTSLDGLVLQTTQASTFPNGWFAGGLVMWSLPGDLVEVRGIRQHTSGSLTLLGGTFGLSPGMEVILLPGCVRTISACTIKFDNHLNYGGITKLMGRSVFDGNSIW